MPGSFLLGTLASLAGLCIFAHFTNIGCDPLADGKISNPNQVNTFIDQICNNRRIFNLPNSGNDILSRKT